MDRILKETFLNTQLVQCINLGYNYEIATYVSCTIYYGHHFRSQIPSNISIRPQSLREFRNGQLGVCYDCDKSHLNTNQSTFVLTYPVNFSIFLSISFLCVLFLGFFLFWFRVQTSKRTNIKLQNKLLIPLRSNAAHTTSITLYYTTLECQHLKCASIDII